MKVLDMGLARLNQAVGAHDETADETLTGTGQAMGTIDYMPPEQAENTKTADERADIYSLGCTLFYLLTGRAIYSGDTVVMKLLAHREAEIPPLRAERPEVPEQLDLIYQKMVAKRPQDRYKSTTQVIAELKECAAPRHEQFEETTDLGSSPISSAHRGTLPVIKTERTPADESLPLDCPVVSPVDDVLLARPKQVKLSKQQIIYGSVVAAGIPQIDGGSMSVRRSGIHSETATRPKSPMWNHSPRGPVAYWGGQTTRESSSRTIHGLFLNCERWITSFP